jgi:hypothetical protein
MLPVLATTLHGLEQPRQVVGDFFDLVIDQALRAERVIAFVVHTDCDRAIFPRCHPPPRRPIGKRPSVGICFLGITVVDVLISPLISACGKRHKRPTTWTH